MSEGPVLRLEGVIKEFGGEFGEEAKTRVLHGIDMEVEPGEFAALVGPSGSGKSTLLNLLGLLDRPTAGRVHMVGRDTTDLDDAGRTALRSEALGFVFQFHHLIAALSAADNVMLPLAIERGFTGRALRQRAVEALAEVGLGDRASERITRLSGGQQQRVAIARALVKRPPLLLADEPTGNLDTETADEVFRLMRAKSAEHGIACVFVTHDPQLAERCDRILTLVDGRIVDVRRGRGC